MPCECTSIHICRYSISTVRNYNRGVWRWNILTYRPGGTLPRWQAVQWKIRYCVWCNMRPRPRPPLSLLSIVAAFFQTEPGCLPAANGSRLYQKGAHVREHKQTGPQSSVALLLTLPFCHVSNKFTHALSELDGYKVLTLCELLETGFSILDQERRMSLWLA